MLHHNHPPIEKIPLAQKLECVSQLFDYLKKWRLSNPSNFRIDGYKEISPANPSQWIFFAIDQFDESSYKGKDISGKDLNGTDWNGIYYLSGATRSSSIDFFLKSFQTCNGDPNQIFSLGFTKGKDGNRKKMRIELLSDDPYVNHGWFCKKF